MQQLSLPLGDENRLLTAHILLLAAFGPIPLFFKLNPVDQMILAMLSGRTRDEFALKIFVFFKNKVERWEDLADMQPSAIKKLINGVTYADKKARELSECIREIIALRRGLDLDFLRGWTTGNAHRWIENLTGVGPKVSSAVLNASTLNKRILMVDTAHRRVAKRFGLIPQTANDGPASRMLNRQIPDDWTAEDTEIHHFLIQRLGKETCIYDHPDCSNCPLVADCPTAQAAGIKTPYPPAVSLQMAS